jgi:serine/threonine protein kinase
MYFISKDEVNQWTEKLQLAMQSANISHFYELDKTLGKGQFGLVKLAYHKKNNKKVAIKQVKKRNMTHIEVF